MTNVSTEPQMEDKNDGTFGEDTNLNTILTSAYKGLGDSLNHQFRCLNG